MTSLLITPDAKHFLYRNNKNSYYTTTMDRLALIGHHTVLAALQSPWWKNTALMRQSSRKSLDTLELSLLQNIYTHLNVQVLIDAINKIEEVRENGTKENKQKKADTDNTKIVTRICFSWQFPKAPPRQRSTKKRDVRLLKQLLSHFWFTVYNKNYHNWYL